MKKIFFIALFTIFAFSAINAQTFGVKAGVNLANVIGEDTPDDFESKIGANLVFLIALNYLINLLFNQNYHFQCKEQSMMYLIMMLNSI
jgi:hypothetical protein